MKDINFLIANHFLFIYFGAFCAHALSLYSNDFKGTLPFLKRIFSQRTQVFYNRIDSIMLPLIGTILAFLLLEPSNVKSALFSGLTWSGTLTAFLQKSNTKLDQSS